MKTFFSIVLIAIGLTGHAQQHWRFYDAHSADYIETSVQSFNSEDDAKTIINNIIAVVGLQPKFEIKEAGIPNAAAVIYQRKRYVLYNPKFVAALNKAAGNQWASVSILAHEIGHHLNGHTLEAGGSRPDIELEADEFSGFVLRKMGASLAEAQVAMKVAANQRASHSHPGQADRLYAIAKGWNNANNQVTGKQNDVASIYTKPAAPASQSQVYKVPAKQQVIDDRFIAKDVYFVGDRSANFFITKRNNLVKVKGDELVVIGKVAASNSAEYPAIIYDDTNTYLLVNKHGQIVTKEGRKVGYVTEHR